MDVAIELGFLQDKNIIVNRVLPEPDIQTTRGLSFATKYWITNRRCAGKQ